MTTNLLLISAAVASVVVIFAGVLLFGDFDCAPKHQDIDAHRGHRTL